MNIKITAGSATAEAELNDSPTSRLVWETLPMEGLVNTWGNEIYFSIPVDAELEQNAREIVEKGEIAYWPTGRAFCIFFGPTPASQGDEIRAYSPVNVIGRLIGDPNRFREVRDGEQARIERAE